MALRWASSKPSPTFSHTENIIVCVSIESRTGGAPRSVVAGDPFDGQLVGPSRAAWVRGSADYGRVAYVTTDGGHTAVVYERPGTDGVIRPAPACRR
jgi:hypothetical protein